MNAGKILVPTGYSMAVVNVAPPRTGDCIADTLQNELQRRLVVLIPNQQPQIVRSVQPPNNKELYWLPVGAEGQVVGQLQGYDVGSGQWIPVSEIGSCISQAPDNVLQLDTNGCLYVPAGNVPGYAEVTAAVPSNTKTSVDVNYQGFNDIAAEINVNWTADPGPNVRWWLTNIAATGVTVNFSGLTAATACNIIARRTTLPQ